MCGSTFFLLFLTFFAMWRYSYFQEKQLSWMSEWNARKRRESYEANHSNTGHWFLNIRPTADKLLCPQYWVLRIETKKRESKRNLWSNAKEKKIRTFYTTLPPPSKQIDNGNECEIMFLLFLFYAATCDCVNNALYT